MTTWTERLKARKEERRQLQEAKMRLPLDEQRYLDDRRSSERGHVFLVAVFLVLAGVGLAEVGKGAEDPRAIMGLGVVLVLLAPMAWAFLAVAVEEGHEKRVRFFVTQRGTHPAGRSLEARPPGAAPRTAGAPARE